MHVAGQMDSGQLIRRVDTTVPCPSVHHYHTLRVARLAIIIHTRDEYMNISYVYGNCKTF